MNGYFGVRWDAPAFEDAPELPTPVGERCLLCDEPIREGESGIVIGYVGADLEPGVAPEHIECFLRSILGSVSHLEKRCSCYGGSDSHGTTRTTRSYRAQARESMEWLILHGQ